MKVKINDIVEAQGALNALGNMKLPNPAAYRMAKNLNLFNSQMKALEDRRMNTLNAMVQDGTAKLNADKTSFDFDPPEGKESFNAAMNEYKQTEVDLQLMRFTLEDMGQTPIEPLILAALDKFGIIAESLPPLNS